MKRLFSAFLALALFAGLIAAFPAPASALTVQQRSYASAQRSVTLTVTESVAPGEAVKLKVKVTGYEDPVFSYAVKKPGKTKYAYLKKETDKTALSYRLKDEGEYSFKVIVTERDGSHKKTSAAAVCIVEEAIAVDTGAPAVLWTPKDDAPAPPSVLTSAKDCMDAINRTVLALGDSVSFPARKLTSFFNQIGMAGDLFNAFLKGGAVSYGAKYDRKTGDGTITVLLEYDSAGQLVKKRYYGTETDGSRETNALEKWVKECIEELIRHGMTDEEKVKAIHDYIVLHFEYDTYTGPSGRYASYADESFTAYGLVKNGYAVCEGYAELFCLLCAYANVPCYPVTGTFDGGKHMWNKVRIDGKWYNVDCTMDDPLPDVAGRVRHTYFLKSDKEFSAAGYVWQSGLWPAA